MKLFNVSKLAMDLRDDALTEWEKARYLGLAMILGVLAGFIPSTGSHDFSMATLVISGVYLAVALVGFYVCYEENQRGDGKNFIERVVILGLPLGIRMYVMMFAAWYAIVLMISLTGRVEDWSAFQQRLMFSLIAAASYFLMFRWLKRGIKIAAAGAANGDRTHRASAPLVG